MTHGAVRGSAWLDGAVNCMAACEVEKARNEAGDESVGKKCSWLDSGRPVGVPLTAIDNKEMPAEHVLGALKRKDSQ